MVKFLLDCGANPNCKDAQDRTPLFYAVTKYNNDIVVAYKEIDPEIINILSDKKDINAQDHYGITVLNLASERSDVETVEQIIEKGADVNLADYSKVSALMTSSYMGNLDICKTLIDNGARVNDFDDEGYTALSMAVKKYCAPNKESNMKKEKTEDFYKVADLLIMNKADINKSNLIGVTPLHKAILSGNEKMSKLLIKKGADINQKTNFLSLSPLHLAVISGNKKVLELLVHNGADINVKSKEGLTPIRYAKIFKQVDIANYLFKNGAQIEGTLNKNTILEDIHGIKLRDLEGEEPDKDNGIKVDDLVSGLIENKDHYMNYTDAKMAYKSCKRIRTEGEFNKNIDDMMTKFLAESKYFIKDMNLNIRREKRDNIEKKMKNVLNVNESVFNKVDEMLNIASRIHKKEEELEMLNGDLDTSEPHIKKIEKAGKELSAERNEFKKKFKEFEDIIHDNDFNINSLDERKTVNGNLTKKSLLHIAVEIKDKIFIEFLLKKGARLSNKDSEGHNVWDYLEEKQNLDMKNLVLKHQKQYDINERIKDNGILKTRMHMALEKKNNEDKIISLLRKGADLKKLDDTGKSSWDYINDKSKETITKTKMEELIKESKKEEIEPEIRVADYKKKLFAEELVNTLNVLEIGEKKHIPNKVRKITRDKIAQGEYLKDLKFANDLIKQQTRKTRDLALIQAIKQSNYKVVRLLLKCGVKPNIIDVDTDSVLILAVKENAKVLEKLKEHLRKKDNRGSEEDKPSDYDIKKELQQKELDSLKIILKLISKGVDVNYTNNRNLTPLYYAREYSPLLDNNKNNISAGEIIMAFGGLCLEKEKLNSIYGYDRVTQSMVVSGIANNDNLLKIIEAAEKNGLDVKEILMKGDRIGYNAYSFADGGYKYFKNPDQNSNPLNLFGNKKIWDSYNILKSTLARYEVNTGLDIKKEKNYATLGRWTKIGLIGGINIILRAVGNTTLSIAKSI